MTNPTQEQLDAEAAYYRLLCGTTRAAKLCHCSRLTVYKRSQRHAERELQRLNLPLPDCGEPPQKPAAD